jgi:hypothetical protein
MTPIEDVLSRLSAVKKRGEQYTARCPAHHDKTPSLSVKEGRDGRVLMFCHAGCTLDEIVRALGLRLSDLFPVDDRRGRRGGEGDMSAPDATCTTAPLEVPGYTKEAYSVDKGLPIALLDDLRVETITVNGRHVVRVPYFDAAMEEKAVRFRHARDGNLRFTWRSGTKPRLYGEWRLDEARAAGYIVLCEGESDTQTLWLHGIPAAGVPGANSWKEPWSSLLDDIATIYVVIEPDKGGQAVRRWLSASAIRERAKLIEMTTACKDVSALHLADPGGFDEAWATLLAAAKPWVALEQAALEADVEAAWELCRELAHDPDIPQRFVETLWRSGMAGEERPLKLVFLCLTSRLLDHIVSGILKGPSSSGKSKITLEVLQYMPDEAHYDLTASSERALAYSEEPLKHRFLVLYEAGGLGEFASMLARTLLSEGRVRYETVESTPLGLVPRLIEREGPTGMLFTTTGIGIDAEIETRMFSIPVNDTPEQTKAILRTQASGRQRSAEDVEVWRALQVWLASGEHDVVVPYAPVLAELTRPAGLRLRRDFPAMLNLIRTHALLHRISRDRDASGAIVATLDDYRAVYELTADIIESGVDAAVPETLRQTVEAVEQLKGENPTRSVTYQLLAAKLGLDRSAARRRAKHCEEKGLLVNDESRQGQPARLRVGDVRPDQDMHILPSPAQLATGTVVQVAPVGPPPPLPLGDGTEEFL